MTRLSELSPGARGTLTRIGGERSFRRRLMELGFLPGTRVRVVRHTRVGDLMEIEVRGCHVSIRSTEAGALEVGELDA